MWFRVNVGCGQTPVQGWKNFDNSPSLHLSRPPLLPRILLKLKIIQEPQYRFIQFCKENNIKYGNALTQADRVMRLKAAIRASAAVEGLTASFMPKPIHGQNGSGMHVHQSLMKSDENVFYDVSDELGLSNLARHSSRQRDVHCRFARVLSFQ